MEQELWPCCSDLLCIEFSVKPNKCGFLPSTSVVRTEIPILILLMLLVLCSHWSSQFLGGPYQQVPPSSTGSSKSAFHSLDAATLASLCPVSMLPQGLCTGSFALPRTLCYSSIQGQMFFSCWQLRHIQMIHFSWGPAWPLFWKQQF